MKTEALFIAYNGAVPIPVTIRDSLRSTTTGDQGSSTNGYAEMADDVPMIVFLVAELADAKHGSIFSVAPGEAYRVERTFPPNDITRKAEVVRLSDSEAAGLPVPEAQP
ncbi:hypothetical protein [Alterisphingorhabdus coralli]|uniref:Uncharacterized protein n=1 Tax=Alterisphingorhabdus coralli TaxID=3071408 RepID=A0AA97F997_9SPHN|nr:hypothetical protein [Parasphingorhabdus sp. SCSIO 66989]WOE76318.1 hypothetical protein RB602_06295 [Parasphingorhabdus sp. SCSIO 66989]